MDINNFKIKPHPVPRYMPLRGESNECDDYENSAIPPCHSSRSHLKPWRLAVLLLGMGNVFLVGFIVSQWSKINIFTPELNYVDKGPIPKLPVRPYAFADDDQFRNLDTLDKVESAWVAVFPQGNGFVHLSNPEKYNLSPNPGVPINSVLQSKPNVYIISAYHQLHCLMLLHRFHVTMLMAHMQMSETDSDSENTTTFGEAQENTKEKDRRPLLDDDEVNHAEHCFIYLRQGVLCSGDITLEQPDNDDLHIGHNPLHGWGTEHVCRDWDVLGEWAEENAAF
ncbi:protein of unknown function (DUF3328) domain containing protein [Rhypophila decipiens]